MYKLRTVDVWDTLLRRECHPECVKLATSWHLFLGWRKQLKPKFSDGNLVYKERLEAESILARQAIEKGNDDEYEITQVFTYWTQSVFADTVPIWLPSQLVEYELSVEISRTYADPDIINFLHSYIADKTLFLSDFYMSREMITRLLAAKGLDTLIPAGLSSCDIGLNKRTGHLFSHIHSMHTIYPEQHIHIGDNEWSDIASPKALGIHSIHYLPETENNKRKSLETLFLSREKLFRYIQDKCTSFVKEKSKALPLENASAMCLGAEAAFLFIGYAIWIAEQSIIEKLDEIFFLNSEGETFHKLFCILFPNSMLVGHELPKTNLLVFSRQHNFSASLKTISTEELMSAWESFNIQSVSELFEILGLCVDEYYKFFSDIGLNPSEIIKHPRSNPKVKKLFKTTSFLKSTRKATNNIKKDLSLFLKSNGISNGKRAGIIDTSMHQTIHNAMALMLPEVYLHDMHVRLHTYINEEPISTIKFSFEQIYLFSNRRSSFVKNSSSQQFPCNFNFQSIKEYFMKRGLTFRKRQENRKANIARKLFAEPFQEGILLAAQIWKPQIDIHVISSNEFKGISSRISDTLRIYPNNNSIGLPLRAPHVHLFDNVKGLEKNDLPYTILLSSIYRSASKLKQVILRLQSMIQGRT